MYAIIDVETTGGNPKNSKITEIAIFKTDGINIIDKFESLVNPEQRIPSFIEKLTGITNIMVQNSPKFYEIAKEIIEFTKDCVFVAHNVSFDYSMFRTEFKNLGYDIRLPNLCTVRASKYILPGYNSYSLGNLAKSMGIIVENRHRAGGDAYATTKIFHKLFEKGENIIKKFIQTEINTKLLNSKLDLNFYDEIPNKTGIYKFFNENNQIIYIGKSKHIKKRIDQHFKNIKSKKGIKMREEITRIEFDLTGSELIALLLESSLIKKVKPVYNKNLKNSNFPYGIFSRKNENNYFEFFIDKIVNQELSPICMFAKKNDSIKYLENIVKTHVLCNKLCNLEPTISSCFCYGLKQCFGACIGKESSDNYNKRALQFIEKQKLEFSNIYLLEKGTNKNEKSIILIEDGHYKGYGFLPYFALKNDKKNWKKYISFQIEDNDSREIIHSYLRKNKEISIISF